MSSINHSDFGVCTDLEAIDRLLELDNRFVVDAGCGNMHLSKALAERGAHVLAIDPDPVQAAKNEKAETITNVGFAHTGAESIPVEPAGVDGVLFPYSLHHVPSELYKSVFDEVLRVLKPDGFCYVMEPVAEGELNEVMRLFHDERAVRAQAQQAMEELAWPHFSSIEVVTYSTAVNYDSWEHFAKRYASKSFNVSSYTEADVRAPAVQSRFEELGAPCNFQFKSPMRITYMRKRVAAA